MKFIWIVFLLLSLIHLSETYPSHLCGPRGKLEFTKLPDKNQASCQIAPMGGLQEAREKQGNTELFMNKQLNNSLHVKGVITDVHHALAHVDGLGQQGHVALVVHLHTWHGGTWHVAQ